jgi:hypothetical protein
MPAEAKYDMTVYPTAGLVRSASDGARTHQVTLGSCDCADFINRKGKLIEVGDVMAVTVCKHIAEFIERAGGWHRPPEPGPVIYQDLTRAQAGTLLTSHHIAADLADRLLRAAIGSSPVAALVTIANGDMWAKYNAATRRYTVAIPAGWPADLPEGFPTVSRAVL